MPSALARIRIAKLEDVADFTLLWTDLLMDDMEQGSHIQPTGPTMDYYRGLFEHFTTTEDGIVIFALAEDGTRVGILMQGAANPAVESDLGKLALSYGTYVAPGARKQGLASAMWEHGQAFFRARGYDHIQMETSFTNQEFMALAKKLGGTWERQVGFLKLGDF